MRPYIVYADVECTLIPEGGNKIDRPVANSACFYFVCRHDSSKNILLEFDMSDTILLEFLNLIKLDCYCFWS